ncbi:hypothetical protein BKA04_001756 [Cryobacterium mesophilum]|uniref:Uncharacterized protein n=1 Tax=Terrimesophilobacter mesophilus TaxID=433647 RepID=A0A4R8VB95_9MICO|nr:hypothetical protein [Terrimesophilobacter mesophilus]MBB5633533.1 hypothetical protein [Terrimesophilobacter mesophilus]TFB80239.1 hypothetical protein E3N84_09465 [Terrimesophilobacter mesophilus]
MSTLERTRQQLDPVGTLGSRRVAVALAGGAFLYGLAMTIRSFGQVSNPMLAVLALAWLAAAAITVAIASSPSRAPFTRSSHTVVQLLALGSVALSAASQWGTNRYIQDDFGAVALGLLILSMGVYRPATELATVGALAAIFVGFVTLLQVPGLESSTPPVSFVLVGMTPILALAFGAASYSGGLVYSLERWNERVRRSVARRTDRMRDGIAESVRQDRVMILGRDVLPFFNSLLERDTIGPDDRARARDIAESIRALMVAEADRTWLEVVAGDDGLAVSDVKGSILDVDGRASWMSIDQRTALRALIVALLDEPSFLPGSMTITLVGSPTTSRGVMTAAFDREAHDIRTALAPYFAVLRVVFVGLVVDYQNSTLTLRFSYEQR